MATDVLVTVSVCDNNSLTTAPLSDELGGPCGTSVGIGIRMWAYGQGWNLDVVYLPRSISSMRCLRLSRLFP